LRQAPEICDAIREALGFGACAPQGAGEPCFGIDGGLPVILASVQMRRPRSETGIVPSGRIIAQVRAATTAV
jgi:hypothetical protein